MPTKTKSANDQLATLEIEKARKHQKVRELKREEAAWIAETESLRAEYTQAAHDFPEESDKGGRPIAGTKLAKLKAEIVKRNSGPSPVAEKLAEAIRAYHAADELARQFRLANAATIVDEIEPNVDAVRHRVTGAAEEFIAALGDYKANAEAVLDFITGTEALNGQHLIVDQRVDHWLKFAEEALNYPLVRPHIGEAGIYRIDQALQAEARKAEEAEGE